MNSCLLDLMDINATYVRKDKHLLASYNKNQWEVYPCLEIQVNFFFV